MKTALICLVIIFLCFVAYAYVQNPTGCLKVATDVEDVVRSLMPGATTPVPAPPNMPAAAPTPPVAPPPAPAPVVRNAVTLSPLKTWTAPAVLPAQPNWTWTTLDGTTYQNVVVTGVDPDTVSITDSLGVAHIAINLLPPDIQKQLNYSPDAASAARAEQAREVAHPYYPLASLAEAQTVARQLDWPLAWLSTTKPAMAAFESGNPPQDDDEGILTAMALNHLKTKAVIVYIDADSEMGQTPEIIHHQFSQYDDGALPGNANYMAPKVVFSSADATQLFGRVSYTQMKTIGPLPLDEAVAAIPNDPNGELPSNIPATEATALSPSTPPASTVVPATAPPAETAAISPAAPAPSTAANPAPTVPDAGKP